MSLKDKVEIDAAIGVDDSSDGELSQPHDAALDFIRAHQGAVDATLHINQRYAKQLRRKVDFLVMPFLLLCYTMNMIDKTMVNYANVMGLAPALNLVDNDYSNASSAFYIAVAAATVPNIYLLKRLPTAKYLGFSLTAWGICTACHAALQNSSGFVAVRVVCGIFESAIPSALTLISAQWYTRSEQAIRFSYWFCGQGIGQILGSLFSWAFQHVDTPPAAPTSGWRMMFLALGLFTVLLGILIILFVPDTPMQAWFFSVEEKINLLEHVRVNQSGISNSKYQPAQLVEGLLDVQMWLMFSIMLTIGVAGGTISTYSATLLRSFGFTPMQSALLSMPAGAISITSILLTGGLARRFGLRWIWCSAGLLLALLGAALIAALPSSNQAGSLAGLWIVSFIVGSGPISYQWVLANTAGHTKRALVAAMLTAAFAVGNVVGPQTFQAKDAPRYQPAKITLAACVAAGVVLTFLLAAYYLWSNRRRDAKSGAVNEDDISDTKAFAGMTDKQNKDFRYRY